MPDHFDLIITADDPNRTAEFRLLDGHGSQIGYRHTDFKAFSASRQRGLFDLRDYLRLYVEDGNQAASVAEIGVCIAEEVLGAEIFLKLWNPQNQRTLRIQLPGASEEENRLVAALARVPWEIARPAANQPILAERNLLVRVVHDMAEPRSAPIELGPGESLRVLFVFAEAKGSSPLAMRRERQELLELFEREIYPKRRVVADVLSHGVTRERLEKQLRENCGYHVVHWSGHGHRNLLELAREGGGGDRISGKELLDLCGGFIPRLVFLSACHSGDILHVKDWNDFLAVAQGQSPGTKQAPPAETKDIPLASPPGYTGTAYALLQGGVPSVVAMRYAVGDEYARDLGVEFYRALLAYPQPQDAAAALTTARKSLRDRKKTLAVARYAVCDHATPVLYGAAQPGLILPEGRSPGLNPRDPRLHRIAELTTAGHEHFVGRTWELDGLGAEFIGSREGVEVKPVAVITGLGGMGKTALAAEMLALWESRFEWVLLYQAKPNPLGIDRDFFWDLHIRTTDKSDSYRERVKANSRDAIWLPAERDFAGARRMEVMIANLIEVFRAHSILLVLDNFETNLKPQAEPNAVAGEPVWACQDPAWDRCLARLAEELAGSPSRVLITCRRPLAALAGAASHPVLLGPLPPDEAALYLREHEGLRKMIFGGDTGERALAMRLLNASRFYPLLMDRLARLATGGPELRAQLMQALDTLEQRLDLAQLPDLFATDRGNEKERDYLNDALTTSLDQLIRDASPDARRLLWMIALANEPVDLGLLKGVWSGESYEQQRLRWVKQMLDRLPQLPPERQAQLKDLPPELRTKIDALPPDAPARPDPAPLLRHLVAVGLATEECTGPEDDNPELTCHDLVRERIFAWMLDHPADRADLTENAIRLAYAERLEWVFRGLQHQNMTTALEAGSRALVYCVQAGAYDRLASFASDVVTCTLDPRLLKALLPHLEAAAESAPEGEPRWSCLGFLADALRQCNCPDASLPFYEQAATQARTTAEAGTQDAGQAWEDLAWITSNWANALCAVGDLDNARQRFLDSAAAEKKSGSPAISIIGVELEILRIDIKQGKDLEALPQVEARLAKVETWWQQHRTGRPVLEAPDAEILARVLISAIDIAKDAHLAQEDWKAALRRIDDLLKVQRSLERPAVDIARTHMNRAVVLGRLRPSSEAQAELEKCLQVFQDDPACKARVLGSLATLFEHQGDLPEAITQGRRALALFEQLPDLRDRAGSHYNLALYLDRSSTPSALAEALRHQVAALVYQVIAQLGQDLQTSLHNYAIRFRRARDAGTQPAIPRLAALLADPAFRPLEEWLRRRGADVSEVQAAVDQYLEMARQAAMEEESIREPFIAMHTPTTPQRPIAELVMELEAAVRAGDRNRATTLERAILQRLAAEAADHAAVERRVRELMQELELASTIGAGPDVLESLSFEKGAATRGAEGVVYPTRPARSGRSPSRATTRGAECMVYPVWFGTNRKPSPTGDGFTGERHDRVTLGRVEVYVPEAHRFGETGNAFWTRLLRFDLRDDRLRVQRVHNQDRGAFHAEIQRAMQDARETGETPHALVFLHGFNVTFADAAIRAAQIGYDLKVPGATAFFSWPSRGNVAAYPADEASIEASEGPIADFLVDFAANCGAERVHVIAHSMGNRGLLRALQRIAATAQSRGRVKFGQVFLAAPDIDRDLFLDLARLYPEHAERTTLYASDADLAVHLSSRLHDAPRAGYYEPYTVAPHIDTVAVPGFDIDLLGHSYFAQAEALLHDIHDLMRHNEDPARRQRIAAAVHEGTSFWRLQR